MHEKPIGAFDAMALLVREGVTVRDLKTWEECQQAITDIDMQIESMLSQISRAEADPTSGMNKPGWRSRVQGAIRWKKRTRKAVNVRLAELSRPAGNRPAGSKDALRHIILDTFRLELGDAEFDRIADIARARYSVAQSLAEGSNQERSGAVPDE
ncbi:MAG: hypothetical protein ABS76_15675 [Pelagibacterium sp. SCN 64-44]|nr:MAG: hypothetical protein ABS76_15675 [Pelagibacterium sp. SCN 64-44]